MNFRVLSVVLAVAVFALAAVMLFGGLAFLAPPGSGLRTTAVLLVVLTTLLASFAVASAAVPRGGRR